MMGSFRLSLILGVLLLCFSGDGICQQNQLQNPRPDSPLSDYAPTGIQAHPQQHLTPIQGKIIHNAGALNLAPTFYTQNYQTVDVDFGPAIRGYALTRKCTLDEAFSETVKFLNLRHDKAPEDQKGSAARAIYSIVGKDVYRITARPEFFEALPYMLKSVEHGKRLVQVEFRFLKIPAEKVGLLQSYLVDGRFQTFNNKIPKSSPYATNGTYANAATQQSVNEDPKPESTFVAATETVTKSLPTFIGRLDSNGLKRIIEMIQSDAETHLVLAPKVVVFPGQTATVSDVAHRPFVVGINRIQGEFAEAEQPIVQSVEDGSLVRVRALSENGKIRLDGDMAISEIVAVDTFSYPKGPVRLDKPSPEETVIQVPQQRVKQVHWSTLVAPGETLLIDPVFDSSIQIKKGKSKTYRTLVLATPKLKQSEE